jgi:replicative superfamily II helicase
MSMSQLPFPNILLTNQSGVNLPAHLVVIKGTQQYTKGSLSEYSELDIMQMIGRA